MKEYYDFRRLLSMANFNDFDLDVQKVRTGSENADGRAIPTVSFFAPFSACCFTPITITMPPAPTVSSPNPVCAAGGEI